MAYNLDAIKQKIADLNGDNKPKSGKQNKDRPKLTWFKPKLGNSGESNSYEIRFLPFVSKNEQPVQEVSYYDNKQLHEYRLVAPAQFGKEDPVFDFLEELRKDRSKESFRMFNSLRPKDRYYVPIIVRGEEDKGVQVWELNPKLLKDIYSTLAHPDYAEENMMDPTEGFDFTLKVTDSGKTFQNYIVKDYDLQPRRKSSPLAPTKKAQKELVDSIPDLEGYFESMVRDGEYLTKLVENFIAKKAGGDEEEVSSEESKTNTVSRGAKSSDNDEKAAKDIDSAFADLDDDDDDIDFG